MQLGRPSLPVALWAAAAGVVVCRTWHFRFFLRKWLARRLRIPCDTRAAMTVEALTSFTTTICDRVWPDDCDLNCHMNNSRYNWLCDAARYAHLIALGFDGRSGSNGGVCMRFKRGLRPFERYELRTTLHGWDAKWLWVQHNFVDATTGRVRACGLCKLTPTVDVSHTKPVLALAAQGYAGLPERYPEPGRSAGDLLLQAEAFFGKD